MTELIHTDKRSLLRGSAAVAGTLALPRVALTAPDAPLTIATAPLQYLDPLQNDVEIYEILRPTLYDTILSRIAIERCWSEYNTTGQSKYAEWAGLYAFNHWRMVPLGAERVRVSKIGRKLSLKFRNDFPAMAAGHFWSATFLGLEAISRGILDAVQLIPEYQRHLAVAEEIDPTYFYASPLIALAKLYIKTPRFPVSVGNLKKGIKYLERARPHQEKVFALWYVFMAEAEYLTRGREAAEVYLAQLDEVVPENSATRLALEMSIQDARGFRAAIETGEYNKYTWDPLLTPLNLNST